MKFLVLIILFVFNVSGGEPSLTKAKLKAPSGEVLAKELSKVTQVFSEELKSIDVDQKVILVDKFIELSEDEKNADTKYALLIKARDVSLDILSANKACRSTYAILDEFDIDESKECIALIQNLIRRANPINENHPVVQKYGKDPVLEGFRVNIVALLEQSLDMSIEKRRADELKYLMTAAQWAQSNQWETNVIKVRVNRAKLALEMLALPKVKDDEYEILVNNAWTAWLPKLTEKSGLFLLAQHELKAVSPEERLAVVDGWQAWVINQKEFKSKEQVERSIGLHSKILLNQCIPNLSGLMKAKAEKMLLALDQKFPSLRTTEKKALEAPQKLLIEEEAVIRVMHEKYLLDLASHNDAYDAMVKQWQSLEPGIREGCFFTVTNNDGSTSTRFDQQKYEQHAADFRDSGNRKLAPLKVALEKSRQDLRNTKSQVLTAYKNKAFQNGDEKSQQEYKQVMQIVEQYLENK